MVEQIKKLLRASVIVNNEKKTCLASCPSSCDESHGNVIPPQRSMLKKTSNLGRR